MCELLGVSSNLETNIKFSSIAMALHSHTHNNGWGLAFYPNSSKSCQILKEPSIMLGSSLLDFVNNNNLIKSKIILNHIRLATSPESFDNTHPFSRELFGQNWSFIHNGGKGMDKYFKQYLKENNNKIDFIPIGFTGSDKGFCIILNELKKQVETEIYTKETNSNLEVFSDYNFDTAQKIIFETCTKIRKSGAQFNMILSNGEYLIAFFSGYNKLHYVLRNGNNIDIDVLEKEVNEKAAIIATEKLTEVEGEEWEEFNPGEMIVFKDGEIVKSFPKLSFSNVEVYDSSSDLDNIREDQKVIGLSGKLKVLLNVNEGDKIQVSNGTKKVNLIVYNSDIRLSLNGTCQAENPEIHVCIPREIRKELNLTEIPSSRNTAKFKKMFTHVKLSKIWL